MSGLLEALYNRVHSSLASPSMLPKPSTPRDPRSWQAIAQKAQDHRDASIALVSPPVLDITDLPLDSSPIPKSVLTNSELAITESDPADLVLKLASGFLTAEIVTNAFLRRAALAQKLVNCVTELMPDAAIERAKYLDAYLKEHGKPIGPLHGLPISVKEHINMAGLTCNAGFISWHDRIPDENAHILDILLDAGAILYARTTEPQTLMHLETDSNIHGVTVNPFNRNLTSGGSSGGEGALIGLRGSCLGIGTDIGGSIRGPAANNGVYGLRPTSFRLPTAGFSATMLGEEHIIPVVGPLSTSISGVKLFMQTLIDANPWLREPSIVPMPWKWESQISLVPGSNNKKLKIGVMYDDGVVKPHPPILRALTSVVEKLRGVDGIEIVQWTPYKHDYAWTIISTLYFADGGSEELDAIAASGEPLLPLSKFILQEQTVLSQTRKGGLSVKEVWEWTVKRDDYKAEYAKKWDDIDIILCPVGPGAAPPHNQARYWGYTSLWNLLDYPAAVGPVTRVDPAVDGKEEGYVPRNEKDRFNYELYEPEKYRGAPVSLQVVGRRYEDEKVVEAMEYIWEKLKLPWAKYV